MRSASVVRYSRVPGTPWKNGLGLTRQLAIHPCGATAENFEWRISVAQLEQSADFSLYPGIERCLAVLDGEMILQRASREPLSLTRESAPVSFSGDEPSSGQVMRGPVLDLNVMFRPAHWHASVQRYKANSANDTLTMEFAAQSTPPSTLQNTLVCSLSAALHLQLAGLHLVLGQYDLLLASGDWQQICTTNDYDLYCIKLLRH